MSSTYSSVPWTAEELTRFEALNPPCLSIVPVHLFSKHSANRPLIVDEGYSQMEWLPLCPIPNRLYSTVFSRGINMFSGNEPFLGRRCSCPPLLKTFSQSTS